MSAVAARRSDDVIVSTVRASVGDVPVLLCGSRAAGTSTAESDYDLLVAMPRRRIPFALRRLSLLSGALSEELAAPVSVNPLPLGTLGRRSNLFVWKLRREARVLAPENGFVLPAAGAPPLDDNARFSYLMSALLQLLAVAGVTDEEREHAIKKALLHAAQLRLWARGSYPSTLEQAVTELQDDELSRLASQADSPEAWREARSLVLAELAALRRPRDLARAARMNLRYSVLAALRGRFRLLALTTLRPIDQRLADRAVELALAADEGPSAAWRAHRDRVLEEWPDAHPLIAQ